MDTLKQPATKSQAPAAPQSVEEWQGQLTIAIRLLREKQYFRRYSGLLVAFDLPLLVILFTMSMEHYEWFAVLLAFGLGLLFITAIMRQYTQRQLGASNVTALLVEGRLPIDEIVKYVPPRYREHWQSRVDGMLSERLKVLAENLDWFMNAPRRLVRLSWYDFVAAIIFAVVLVLMWALATFHLVPALDDRTGFYIVLALALLMSLPNMRSKVWAEELFRDVGFRLGEDFFLSRDERKGGASIFRRKLERKIAQTNSLVMWCFTLLLFLPFVAILVLWGFDTTAGLAAVAGMLGSALAFGLATGEMWRHGREVRTALDESSMALKLLAGEIDADRFSLPTKLMAPLFGAPLNRGSIFRTAAFTALEPRERLYIKPPERKQLLPSGTELGLIAVLVLCLEGGYALASGYPINFLRSPGIVLLACWAWQWLLIAYARRGARVIEFLKHLQLRMGE